MRQSTICLRKMVERTIRAYIRVFYYEFPVFDANGRPIGHEWYGLRTGRVERDEVVEMEEESPMTRDRS